MSVALVSAVGPPTALGPHHEAAEAACHAMLPVNPGSTTSHLTEPVCDLVHWFAEPGPDTKTPTATATNSGVLSLAKFEHFLNNNTFGKDGKKGSARCLVQEFDNTFKRFAHDKGLLPSKVARCKHCDGICQHQVGNAVFSMNERLCCPGNWQTNKNYLFRGLFL